MRPIIYLHQLLTIAEFTGEVISISAANGIQLRGEDGEVKSFSFSEIEEALT